MSKNTHLEVRSQKGSPEVPSRHDRRHAKLTSLEDIHPWVLLQVGHEPVLGLVHDKRDNLALLVDDPQVSAKIMEVPRA